MDLKQLITEDDAVSPVIGVILMVAITVILAAVIGAFVLNIGGNQESAPQASYAFDYDSSISEVSVTHDGGGTVDGGLLTINAPSDTDCLVKDEQFSAGDDMVESTATGNDSCVYSPGSGEEIKITWTASSGDSSQIVAESQVP